MTEQVKKYIHVVMTGDRAVAAYVTDSQAKGHAAAANARAAMLKSGEPNPYDQKAGEQARGLKYRAQRIRLHDGFASPLPGCDEAG